MQQTSIKWILDNKGPCWGASGKGPPFGESICISYYAICVCLKAPTFRRFFFDNFHMSQEEAVDSGSGGSSSTVVLYSSLVV